ncbi:uncharacterized protein LOC116345309 [Contarinia nasturtii]|uniref:uncharacterized protein LOC116345309 n=1 Tax=Contarinia nasturtii TaxID=265458 RepID=UPI0012D37BF0|nr:uncharacterized protein LOC116345309 [Contarinia nasturtii]
MLTIRIISILTFMSGLSLAWIPYKGINFVLTEDFPNILETRVNQSLQTTKSFFERKEVEVIGDTRILKFVPYLAPMIAALPIAQDTIGSEYEWRRRLDRAIPDVKHRQQAEHDMRTIEMSMRTVARNIINLDPNKNFSSDSKITIVHDIHTGLCNIVSKFAQRHSIFRKYPLVGMPILLSLSSFVSLFVYMESAFVPDLARASLISCKLYKTLFEYRPITVEARLHKLEIADSMGEPIHNRQPINDVLAKSVDENYNQTLDNGSLRCRKGCRPFEGEYVYVCLRDPISRTEYDCHMRHEMYGCLFGYMEYVRYRVENAFADAIQLVAKTCTDEARNQPLQHSPTGFGWWTIAIHGGEAHTDIFGNACDDWGACDAYIKILVEGKEVYRTECRVNTHMPYFGETYRSPRIHKSVRITIELWDEDSGWMGSPDALMMRWETNIDQLVNNGIKWGEKGYWKNKIVTASSWKDEYPDNFQPMLLV